MSNSWSLWKPSETLIRIPLERPLLASWDAGSAPTQVRLRSYQSDVRKSVGELPADGDLGLQLEVGLGAAADLLHQCDLENYLTPLFASACLPHGRFVFASAKKRRAPDSFLTVSRVEHRATPGHDWSSFCCGTGSGPDKKEWKIGLSAQIAATVATPLPPGPVAVTLAWRCAPTRNWTTLWKPTGDSMGAVLGVPNPVRPFHLFDDRIVSLECHLCRDTGQKHNVDVGMWWRPLPAI